jgi:putative ABC transport system permease protein
MNRLWQDLRYGMRMLLKRPGFTLVAVITLALGIGANTAIFSVVNAVLLRALPYHNPHHLAMVFATDAKGDRDVISIAEAQDLAAQLTTFDDFAAMQSQSVNLTGLDQPERVRGGFVTANFFDVFNLSPLIGRTFARGEDQPGADRTVVVNEGFWQRHLNSDADISGKKVILNGEPYSVIGVITSAFKHPMDPEVEVWITAQRFPGNTGTRESRYLFGIGHIKANATLEQAQAEIRTIAAKMAEAYPNENAGRGAKTELLSELMVSGIRPMLLVLFAAVGCILLIACANLANLTLARGAARRKEFALRAALGAGRFRLVRQLLTETTLLALIGGGLGLLIASWGIEGLMAVNPGVLPPKAATLDTRVLLFTLAAAVLTGIIFGLAPALQLSRFDLHTALKEGGRAGSEGAGARRARGTFVVVQVALSLVLLTGGALLIKSFYKLLQVDPGFRPANLLTLEYRLPRNKYTQPDGQWQFHRQVIDRIQEVPGVQTAALVRGLPFSGNGQTVRIALPDREAPPKGQEPLVMWNTATANYFETIGIPLIKGRLFDSRDQLNTPVVFVINQTMARRFWPDQDPLGKQIKLIEDGSLGTVVGIVGDARHYYLNEEQQPQVYDCYGQFPGLFATVVARTEGEPMSLAQSVREAVWKVDKDQPMWKVRTEEFLINRSIADRRFLMLLMGIFAALALTITAVGLYGVVSYTVGQRTQEIGIRMALGAATNDILAMILRQGMGMVLIGVAVGLAAAFALTRLMASLLSGASATDPIVFTATALYGTSATDPLAFALIALLIAGVALLACWIPARRATKVDPMVALRYE